ncbi:MAG TPA: L,D-transpeptidase [Fontimonas sp.]
MQIEIDLPAQLLRVRHEGQLIRELAISSAANGPGEIQGSGCTPRGRHRVRAKIGADLPPAAVLKGRRWTGEVWSPALQERHPDRDWILTRILWLSGCEIGRNRLGCVDTFRRYVYIHGTPYADALGTPQSKGCIRMSNADVLDLFELIPPYTEVEIHE